MKRFSNDQRIRIVNHDNPAMVGMVGMVVRLRRQDDGAFVRMDSALDTQDFPFRGDDDDRTNNTLLYPDQCELEGGESNEQ